MAWEYAYTPEIWLPLGTILLLLSLATYSWRHRSVPGALVFAISCLLSMFWMTGSLMQVLAVEIADKIFWHKVVAAWQMPATTAVTCFVLEYVWPGRWLTRRNLALLAIVPLATLGLIATNDVHHLVWSGFAFEGSVVPQSGPAFWPIIIYACALGLLEFGVFAWLFIRSPQHRWPVIIMTAGIIMVRVLWVLERAQIMRTDPSLNLLSVPIVFLTYAVALFAFRVFDPIPLARQTVIEQLQAGVLVLDLKGRIASLNPGAERMFLTATGASAGQILGRSIRDVLPGLPEGQLADNVETEIELALPAGQEMAGDAARCYTLVSSPLKDWRGLEAGRLVLLHDVTEQKQAQAQIIEQQRALAMLQEREQLARELHDSTGQVLGFANLKIGAVRKLIADGKLAGADDQLARLERVLAEAHADVREYILNLHVAPTGETPFFAALEQYLDGFRQNYGIGVDLSVGEGVDEEILAPEARMQLFRILQEALSNARKHARTDRLQVSFEREDTLVRIRIQDNGSGFDPQQAARKKGHFGLRFMRERAEQLGGTLRVDSAPAQGTRVTVDLPLEGKA
jgi:PAS domain S-box-containing protein